MALQTSGQISLSNVAGEKGVTLSNVSLVTLSTTSINTDPCNTTNPNNGAPHSIAEFYGYDHSCVTPPTGLNQFNISGSFRSELEACELNVRGEGFFAYSSCSTLFRGCVLYNDPDGKFPFGVDAWFYDSQTNTAIYIDIDGMIQSTVGCG